jgi:hypothetical protein
MSRQPNLLTDNSLGALFLRAWLWLVPIGMLLAAGGFGAYAAVDGRWGLFGVMIVMAMFALGLLVLHYWIVFRFGKEPGA